MNIIYAITSSVDNVIRGSGDDITQAFKVASNYMNRSITSEEKKDLIAFSEKVEAMNCPSIKSIQTKEIDQAIWNVVCWRVRSILMSEKILDLLLTYTEIRNLHFKTVFNELNEFRLKIYSNDVMVNDTKLESYFGLPLMNEIFTKINECANSEE